MKLLDLTLDDPAANVALDDALVEEADEIAEGAAEYGETLRIWEPRRPMIVLGRSSRLADEVDTSACQADGVPIVRRASGGATIVTGPGCLMYAIVLSYRLHPELRAIDLTHRYVLDRLATSLGRRVPGVACRGTSDLALSMPDGATRKFSGNSMRCRRDHVLYHGTLLYAFDLQPISRWLKTPPRQPEYRAGRDHGAFLCNLPLDVANLRAAVVEAFDVNATTTDWSKSRVEQMVAEKYGLERWTRLL